MSVLSSIQAVLKADKFTAALSSAPLQVPPLIYGTKKLQVRGDLTHSALAKLQELWQQLELQSCNQGCCYSSIFLIFPCIEVVSCWAHLLQLWPISTTMEKT